MPNSETFPVTASIMPHPPPIKSQSQIVLSRTEDHDVRLESGYSFPSFSRRQLLLAILLLMALVYAPRLPRFETYLLVTTKRSLGISPPGLQWKVQVEQSLKSFEQRLQWPFGRLQAISQAGTLYFNSLLEKQYCSPDVISRYFDSKPKVNDHIPLSQFYRICKNPLQKEELRQLTKLGLTPDGKIILRPGDRVFIAGDSLMQGPATQLQSRLRAHGIQAIDASRVSTGLAYPQFFDWVARIKSAIIHERVDAVFVFLGANDTFDIYDGQRRITLGTPAWQDIYKSRINQIVEFAQKRNIPLIWLGMPAMNRRDIQPYVPMMNRLFNTVVTNHRQIYVPTDTVLGHTEKSYTPVKMIGGQRLIVRADDGVHFTPTGWSLVADSVMKHVIYK